MSSQYGLMNERSASMSESATRDSVTSLMDKPRAQVLVIGGGINGIAAFRDLALQGVDVALVERGDYCSGASAASSHMIHGGIRYLENGEFRLVRESVQERNGLLRIAPHYVKPLQTTVPIYSTFSGIVSAPLRFLTHKSGAPSERGALLIKVGLVLYDSFSRNGGTVPRHVFVGRKKSLETLPQLNPNVKYTATYFDASVHEPERLALDVLHDGLATGSHARASNYVEAVGATDAGVLLRDVVTGREFTMQADVVVNASGPWTDLTNEALGDHTDYMGGTKGSHIVLDNPELLAACAGREMFFEHKDGRIVLIYPLNGKVMVGTTDLEADIRQPAVCTDEEIDYFFDLIANVFPKIAVDRDQIVFSFSGVRPLPHHDDLQPGFVSRDYRIVSGTLGSAPLLSVVGGKWTTFRALAEHITNDALALLKKTRSIDTTRIEIGGGRGYPRTDEARNNWITAHSGLIGMERAKQLFDRYGTRAVEVLDTLDSSEDSPLVHTSEFTRLEVEHIVATESVVHMSDILLRRTNLAFTGAVTVELLEELTEIAAGVLGWSHDRKADEIRLATATLADAHRVELAHSASVSAQ
jgi:glycerol-3-phosphate dehydrogenase